MRILEVGRDRTVKGGQQKVWECFCAVVEPTWQIRTRQVANKDQAHPLLPLR